MTDEWAADRAVIDAATDGPWPEDYVHAAVRHIARNVDWIESKSDPEFGWDRYNDGAFIAQARTRWPAALDRIAELEALAESRLAVIGDLSYRLHVFRTTNPTANLLDLLATTSRDLVDSNAERDAAIAAIERVRALHVIEPIVDKKWPEDWHSCRECTVAVIGPDGKCPTIRALDGEA